MDGSNTCHAHCNAFVLLNMGLYKCLVTKELVISPISLVYFYHIKNNQIIINRIKVKTFPANSRNEKSGLFTRAYWYSLVAEHMKPSICKQIHGLQKTVHKSVVIWLKAEPVETSSVFLRFSKITFCIVKSGYIKGSSMPEADNWIIPSRVNFYLMDY